MTPPPNSLPIGTLGRPHGLHGELFLRPYNPGGLGLLELRLPLVVQVERDGAFRAATIRSMRPAGADYLVVFEGLTSRETAAALTNGRLHVPRAALPPLEAGEFYVQDVIGCTACDPAGQKLGVVRSTFWNGAQDILSIVGDDASELLVPAVPAFVREVDVVRSLVTILVPDEATASGEADGETGDGDGQDEPQGEPHEE